MSIFSLNKFPEKTPSKTCFTTHFQVKAILSPDLTLERSRFGGILEYNLENLHLISLK